MSNTLLLIIFVLIQLVIWIGTLFIQGYIKKKGEYLATKEDIKEITNKVEEVKGQIEVSTSNEKWFINEQNKALIKLSKDVFSIISTLKSFPEFGGIPIDLANKFYSQIMNEFSTQKLNLGYLSILFDNKQLLEIIEDYYKVLAELSHNKREAFEQLEKYHRDAQIPKAKITDGIYYQELKEGDFCMQPDKFFKTRADYFKSFDVKVYGKEYDAFTIYVREFLKTSHR